MGTELPVVRNAGKPFLDNQGLWIEAEIVYAGGFTVSLETNVSSPLCQFICEQNLMKKPNHHYDHHLLVDQSHEVAG